MNRRSALAALVLSVLYIKTAHAKAMKSPAGADASERSPGSLYLTMDDGYRHIETVIEDLKQCPIPVTFFPTGEALRGNKRAWQELSAAGHEFGCHTYSHVAASNLSTSEFAEQLTKFKETAIQVLGTESAEAMRYFRFPYGDFGKKLQPEFSQIVTEDFGWKIIGWDLCISDEFPAGTATRRSTTEFADMFARHVRADDVILMHFVNPDYLSIPHLVARAKQLNLEFKRLSTHPNLAHCGAVGRAPYKRKAA